MFSFKRSGVKPNGPIMKKLPSTASTTYKIGDALVLSSGGAVLATGTTKPTHICAQDYVAPASGMLDIAVYEISPSQEWETTFSANGSSLKIGDKVTIHTDGEQVTATTSSGVAELVTEGKASGGKVVVKFS